MSLELKLTCDYCGRECDSGYTEPGRMSVDKLMRDARDNGWRRLDHGWFCDRCIARLRYFQEPQRKDPST